MMMALALSLRFKIEKLSGALSYVTEQAGGTAGTVSRDDRSMK